MSIPVAKQYILDFEQLGLGMFIHWGLYSQLGRGEWIFALDKMNMEEYKNLANTFTAEDFNAEDLVLLAKEAGCGYVTLTTRHHEGFSLYDTCGLNEFDAPHSPAGRDLIREFVDACNKHGIMPMFYHTTLDWYNKDFEENFDEYLKYLNKSVEVLCTNYGKIGGLWFDGNWSKPDSDWKVEELYATIRKHQPEAMIINNTGMVDPGHFGNIEIDSITFEQGKPTPMNREGMPKYIAAEMCHTLNEHWAYSSDDLCYKSPVEVIQSLCDCRRVGANYLLNIGPEAQGKVNPYQREQMKLLGRWMKVFGESIYNGRPCGVSGIGKNFALKSVDGKSLYLFVFDLAEQGDPNVTLGGKYRGVYAFGGVNDEIKTIKWMDNGEELDFVQGKGILGVNLTGHPYGLLYPVRVAKAEIK